MDWSAQIAVLEQRNKPSIRQVIPGDCHPDSVQVFDRYLFFERHGSNGSMLIIRLDTMEYASVPTLHPHQGVRVLNDDQLQYQWRQVPEAPDDTSVPIINLQSLSWHSYLDLAGTKKHR